MTPVPFELPLRANEAAAIADLLFRQVEGRPLTDDQRGRFAGRLSSIETPSVTVYPGSLAADPIHPSTYYLAVDGANHGLTSPLLLRIGLASAPGTGLFPKSVMIGRMRPSGQREVVVSAIPFGPEDYEQIQTFAELVDKSFLPKPHGGQAAVTVRSGDPAAELPAAFEAMRQLPRATGVAMEVPLGSFWTAVWAAVRAGRREAYSVGTVIDLTGGREAALRQVEQAPLFTKYVIPASGPEQLGDVGEVMDHVRRAKSGLGSVFTRTVDFELAVETAEQVPAMLSELKEGGRAVQFVSPGRVDSVEALLESMPASTLLTVAAGTEVPHGARVNQRLVAGADLRAAMSGLVAR